MISRDGPKRVCMLYTTIVMVLLFAIVALFVATITGIVDPVFGTLALISFIVTHRFFTKTYL